MPAPRSVIVLLALALCFAGESIRAEAKGKVLVVLSSRPSETSQKTSGGFSLPGLMIPALQIVRAGYSPVFANPLGDEALLDPVTDNAKAFGNDEKVYRQMRTLCESWGVCVPGETSGKVKLFKLAQIRAQGMGGFAGVFVPGGRRVSEDLRRDPNLGAILTKLHLANKPIALVGNGVVALLSTLKDPESFVDAATKGEAAGARALSESWTFRSYWMTAASAKDEQRSDGSLRALADELLDRAGGKVQVRAIGGRVNVLVDRELITGENAASAELLGDTFVKALDACALRRRR